MLSERAAGQSAPMMRAAKSAGQTRLGPATCRLDENLFGAHRPAQRGRLSDDSQMSGSTHIAGVSVHQCRPQGLKKSVNDRQKGGGIRDEE
jgi:hypothetical protein